MSILNLTRAAFVFLIVFASFASVAAQTPAPATPQPAPQTGATADENFELNIDLRRISESDFQAQTAVETDGAGGLLLKVGVALRARDIEVVLQGVRGRVRFRANLAPVLRLLDARRGATPAAQSPPETSP